MPVMREFKSLTTDRNARFKFVQKDGENVIGEQLV